MEIVLASDTLTVAEGDGDAVVVVKRTGDLSIDAIVDCYTTDGKMIMHNCRHSAHGAHKCDYKMRLEHV